MKNAHWFRGFKADFLAHIDSHGGFPPMDAMMDWFESRGFARDRSAVSALCNGDRAKAKFAHHVVDMLLARDGSEELASARRAMDLYLLDRDAARPLLVDDALAYVAMPLHLDSTDGRPRRERPIDTLRMGLQSIATILPGLYYKRVPEGLASPADASVMARWFYIYIARQLHSLGDRVGFETAYEYSSHLLMRSVDEYAEHLLAWARTCPWSVVFARLDRQRVGACSCIPVSLPVYEQLAAGRRSPLELDPSEIEPHSRYLALEVFGLSPTASDTLGSAATAATMKAFAVQMGALMRYRRFDGEGDYRLLAPSAVPDNAAALRASGFVPIGSTEPLRGVKLWEKAGDFATLENTMPFEEGIFHFFGKHCGNEPRGYGLREQPVT
jgi:hypothetical protein